MERGERSSFTVEKPDKHYLSQVKVKDAHSCLTLQPHGLHSPWNSPGQNTGVDSLSLLQGIFPTQGLNTGLLHCRRILYPVSHQRSPRILEWVAYPFSRGSSRPRNQTLVSCIADGFFAIRATRETHFKGKPFNFRTNTSHLSTPNLCSS